MSKKLTIKDTGKAFMVSERCYKLCKSFIKVFNELTGTYPLETKQNLYSLCMDMLQQNRKKIK